MMEKGGSRRLSIPLSARIMIGATPPQIPRQEILERASNRLLLHSRVSYESNEAPLARAAQSAYRSPFFGLKFPKYLMQIKDKTNTKVKKKHKLNFYQKMIMNNWRNSNKKKFHSTRE